MIEFLTTPIFLTILIGLSLGFALFKVFMIYLLPRMEEKEAQRQRTSMLEEANRQRDVILERQRVIKEENLKVLKDEMEEDITSKWKDLEVKEQGLEDDRELIKIYQEENSDREKSITSYKNEISQIKESIDQAKSKLEEHSQEIIKKLSQISEVDPKRTIESKASNIITKKQVELQKSEKLELEELNVKLSRKANKSLSRVLARYSPDFYWPKPINLVEVKHAQHLNKLRSPSDHLLEELKELSGVDINLVDEKEDREANSIKVIGGFGIAKEASRLTLEKVLSDTSFSGWKKVGSIYRHNFRELSKEAERLGAEAVRKLH